MNTKKKYSEIFKGIIIILLFFLGIESHSQVIYTNIEPDIHMSIPTYNGNNNYYFDVNNDSYDDFYFSYSKLFLDTTVHIIPLRKTEFVGPEYSDYYPCADTLSYNEQIDETLSWTNRNDLIITLIERNVTFWGRMKNKFIGFRIKETEGYKYGWIRLKDCYTIADYAINNKYDSNILAGQGIPKKVENLKISDISDFKDGRDLKIQFEKCIDETDFRNYSVAIFITDSLKPDTDIPGKFLMMKNFIDITPDNKDHEIFLDVNSVDYDGDLIREHVSYTVYVMGIDTYWSFKPEYLSYPSNPLYLSSPVGMAKKVTVNKEYLSGGHYRVDLSFKKAENEEYVNEYRLLFVKSSQAIDLSKAKGVEENNYKIVKPSGHDYSVSYYSDNIKDIDGNQLYSENRYAVYILSIADGTVKTENALSECSNYFQLSTPVQPVSLVYAFDEGSNGNGSDVFIELTLPEDEAGISAYRIIACKNKDATNFDKKMARNVKGGNYFSFYPGENKTLFQLTSNFRDKDGDKIKENIPYIFYILSVPDNIVADTDTLSGPSNVITLATPDQYRSYIRAGQKEGEGIIYTNIEPDLSYEPFKESYYFYLDLNNDSINDFRILISGLISPGNSAGCIVLETYKKNSYCTFPVETFPDPLKLNRMIGPSLTWHKGKCFLTDYDYFHDISIKGPWMKLDDRYLGLQVVVGTDTIYGWLGMKISDYWDLTIRDYAYCSKSSNASAFKGLAELFIKPNPATDYFQLSWNNLNNVESIEIISSSGKRVFYKNLTPNSLPQKEICFKCNNWGNGIYLILVKTKYCTISKKILIQQS
ncbi:MAG: T9SS type A sorting domain-containing protein [Prolixibacteraceae bacterium]|nr:T9SS type A sorting domain-containing protein [Prolixibacteraceae bacterium]